MATRHADVLAVNGGTISDPALNTTIGDVLDITWVDDAVAYAINTGVSGTTPSITLQLEVSVDKTNWVVAKTFTAKTTANAQQDGADAVSVFFRRYPFARLVATAKSGTTPALTGVTAGISAKGAVR